MSGKLRYCTFTVLLLATSQAQADTHYVSVNSTNPVPPYTNWATAANVIQEAVEEAVEGDTVLVTNGVYDTGGKAIYGTMTNRVAVDKTLTLASVNGAAVTSIRGYVLPNSSTGNGAIRGVYLTHGAVLSGFTVASSATRSSGDEIKEMSGGAVFCETNAEVRSCILMGSVARQYGGGIYGGIAVNSEIVENAAYLGGGAYDSLLDNCTVVMNQGFFRGPGNGLQDSTATNCVVYYNSGANHSGSVLEYSCTTPAPTNGLGNITNEPSFVDLANGVYRLRCGSPCIDAGYDLGLLLTNDLRGRPRPLDGDGDAVASFDIGSYEYSPATVASDVTMVAGVTNCAVNYGLHFLAQIDGCTTNFWWDFDDGLVLSNTYEVSHAWAEAGIYEVRLIADFIPSGQRGAVTTFVNISDITYYVNATNPTPIFPYTNWNTASTNIQDAVDASDELGRLVLVTNGLYRHGGRAMHGIMTNRVALTDGVRLQSVNGPAQTVIEGAPAPGGGNGDGAVRGVYVDQHSVLRGFTITNGHTLKSSYVVRELLNGGGAWCETGATLTNCVIAGNSADFDGGGVYGGNLRECLLLDNVGYHGGGAANSTLFNCLILSNRLYTAAWGGGALWSHLDGCTVVGNSAGVEGGVHGGVLRNCIVYYNHPNNHGGNWSDFLSCCTTPLPPGPGNLANVPLFVNPASSDFRLQSNSPCINAGNNAHVTTASDLDGNQRIAGGTVDIGAYEFQDPESSISYAWLQQYGLPTDGSIDDLDGDNDNATTWQEWKMWTNPTNQLSVLRMLNPHTGTNGTVVSWQSIGGHSYALQRGTNPAAPFTVIQGNIIGDGGTTSFTDTAATNGLGFFYRIGVEE